MARPIRGKLKVFIDGGYDKPSVFQTTPARYDEAARRHRALAKRVDVTIAESFGALEPVIEGVDVLLGFRFPKDLIRTRAKRLKWMHATGAGVEHLMPLDWLPKGAVLTNNRGVHADKIAESVLMAIVMLNNRMPEILRSQRERRWNQVFTGTASGKTLLIVGVGEMGGAAARIAKRAGLKVWGVRRTGKAHPAVERMVKPEKLPNVLPQADFVLVTTPVTPATRHLIGRRELAAMKPGSALINFGRAGVVDYEALRERLEAGHLSGAWLDVFDPEPLPSSSPLWTTKNLILTPHCTSDDLEGYMPRTLDLFFENIGRLLAGKRLKNLVLPERGY